MQLSVNIKEINNKLFVKANSYNEDLVKIFRSVPGRVYRYEDRNNIYPANVKELLIDKLSKFGVKIVFEEEDAGKGNVNLAVMEKLKDVLFEYQKECILFLVNKKRAFLSLDMGLGKTVISLVSAELLGSKKVLVVCPSTLKYNWQREIDKWISCERMIILNGNKERRLQQIYTFFNDKSIKYLIMGYEQLRIHFFDINEYDFDYVIFDESHRIKNHRAKQSIAARGLSFKSGVCMSGTPLLNRVDELWNQLNVLYPTQWGTYWDFVNRYCAWQKQKIGKREFIKITGVRNSEELKNRLKTVMIRKRKEDVLELPEKIYRDIHYELSSEQKKVYNDIKSGIIVQIEKILDKPQVQMQEVNGILAQITKLRQACTYLPLVIESSNDLGKIALATDLIKDIPGKCVVFSVWKLPLYKLQEELAKEEIQSRCLTGDMNMQERNQSVNEFVNGSEVKVLLSTIAVGGVGLNLTVADTVIFVSQEWTPALNEQSIDRLHRIGQTNKVMILNIVARAAIEDKLQQLLNSKKHVFEQVVNGTIEKTSTIDFLHNVKKILSEEENND